MNRALSVVGGLALTLSALTAVPLQSAEAANTDPNKIEIVHSPQSHPFTGAYNSIAIPQGGFWVDVRSNGPSKLADDSRAADWSNPGETGRAAVRVQLARTDGVYSYRFGVTGGTLSGCVNTPSSGLANISNPPNASSVTYVTFAKTNCAV